ncbi:glycine oxidase ThiO [Bacillus tianshenii]|nr:glycine oxidase ThiO [Bacillus tianshenii]
MLKKFDVIIVGGGVIGCVTAFYLAKEGHKVLLLEKDQVGLKSSSAAAGMLGIQAELTEFNPLYPLAKQSMQLFPELVSELKELTGIDVGYRRTGAIKPAFSEDELTQYSKIKAWQTSQGEHAELLTNEQLLELEPCLSDSILGGLYFPNESQVTATQLVRALAAGATKYGATIEEFQEVLELVETDHQAQGVKTLKGTYTADHVVIASGVWSKNPSLIRDDVELYPLKGEALSLKVSQPILSTTLFSEACYLTPKTADTIFVGATERPYSYDTTPTVNGIYQLLGAARSLLPALGEAQLERVWAGLRPTTPTHLPYIGQSAHVEGLWYAFGHHRNGILLSAATGSVIAALINGRDVDIDLSAFSPSQALVRR